jgi:hypothetical protein
MPHAFSLFLQELVSIAIEIKYHVEELELL